MLAIHTQDESPRNYFGECNTEICYVVAKRRNGRTSLSGAGDVADQTRHYGPNPAEFLSELVAKVALVDNEILFLDAVYENAFRELLESHKLLQLWDSAITGKQIRHLTALYNNTTLPVHDMCEGWRLIQ